jgi:hypothetical protein
MSGPHLSIKVSGTRRRLKQNTTSRKEQELQILVAGLVVLFGTIQAIQAQHAASDCKIF